MRQLVRASRSAARNVIRRGAHVVRHTRLARGRDRGDVFNLDLHVSVISDVRTHLDRHGLELVHWTLSGYSGFFFSRPPEPTAIVNELTWLSFGPRMAKRFRRLYGSYLRTFRGFAATHTPCFALLYEHLQRPTVAVVSTRYEFPFTSHAAGWNWLDSRLRAGVDDGWLTLVANNRADADYLAHYSDLRAVHIPSACSYTGLTYTGRRAAVVVSTKKDVLARAIAKKLRHEAVALRAGLGMPYSWGDLYDHKAVVFIPYNASIMSLFEHYTACIPIYVPNRSFIKELMADYPAEVLSQLSFSQVTGRPAARRNGGLDLNDTSDEAVVDWYLDRADFYDREWMPHIRQFESWEHLDDLLATDDPHAISAAMADERPERLRRIAARWDQLSWLQALAR